MLHPEESFDTLNELIYRRKKIWFFNIETEPEKYKREKYIQTQKIIYFTITSMVGLFLLRKTINFVERWSMLRVFFFLLILNGPFIQPSKMFCYALVLSKKLIVISQLTLMLTHIALIWFLISFFNESIDKNNKQKRMIHKPQQETIMSLKLIIFRIQLMDTLKRIHFQKNYC